MLFPSQTVQDGCQRVLQGVGATALPIHRKDMFVHPAFRGVPCSQFGETKRTGLQLNPQIAEQSSQIGAATLDDIGPTGFSARAGFMGTETLRVPSLTLMVR